LLQCVSAPCRSAHRLILGFIVAVAVMAQSGVKAWSLEAVLRDYHHKAWPLDDGLGAVFALQQAPNGFMWLTTSKGIFRFDGVRFQSADDATDHQIHNADLDSVFVSASGDLWFVTRSKGLLLWKDNHVKAFPDRRCTPPSRTGGIAEDSSGVLWVQSSRGVFRLKDGRCEPVTNEPAFPKGFPRAILMDGAQTLWVKWATGEVFFLLHGRKNFQQSSHGKGVEGQFSFLKAAPDGSVWLSDDRGLRRISEQAEPGTSSNERKTTGKILTNVYNFAFGPDGSLWTTSKNGLQHFRNVDRYAIDEPVKSTDAETFDLKQGLTSNVIWDLTFDREGNLWVGTNSGLDQFRRNAFSTVEIPTSADYQFAIAAGDQNSLWVGSRSVPLTHVFADGHTQSFPETHNCLVIRRAFDGTIWSSGFGDKRLWRVTPNRPIPVDFPQNDEQAATDIAVDRNKELWMTTLIPESYHLVDKEWIKMGAKLGRKPGVIGAMSGDDYGNIWFAFSNNVVQWDGKNYHRYSFPDGSNNVSVAVVAVHGEHIWMGGSGGVLLLSKGNFRLLRWKGNSDPGGVTGLIETEAGDLWLNGPMGVTRVPADELQRWLKDPQYTATAERFGVLDGLPGFASERWPEPSAIESRLGVLWFATTKGVAWIDPINLAKSRNRIPPPVVIESVISNQRSFPAIRSLTRLPHSGNLELNYTALSLSVPERVLFRYKLEGLETDWQEAGARRQAFYTNLAPGRYTFHVIASNNDGVWNTEGDQFTFLIPPAYYQTTWFRAACIAASLATLWGIYRLRLRQVQRQFSLALDARVNERTRIARELHDTLLQSFNGLLLRFQTVSNLLPSRPEEAKTRIDGVIEEGSNAITEGRDAVHELRSVGFLNTDLAESIGKFAKELLDHPSGRSSLDFRVQAEGTPKSLNPMVRDEAYRIAAEALRNAIRHAGAQRIEVEIRYDLDYLRLRIRDDGKGIDNSILDKEYAPGHWGLRGMRERAKLIGGTFEIWSETGSGTEIELKIPAASAYAKLSASRRSFFSRS
jgi:signal transduction histidine kinase/ligand-binding sensor domain-containing protein